MKGSARILLFGLIFVFCGTISFGQRTEISISLSEHFFDTVMDAVFQYSAPPRLPLAGNFAPFGMPSDGSPAFLRASYAEGDSTDAVCDESIRLQRENSGIRTSVRFREGQVLAPLAFSGNYNPPLVGCIDFAGWAESRVDLVFDETGQRLVANATVNGVHLNGTGGMGSSLIARMVQNSIDRRINPIEIIKLDKISLMLPLQNSSNIRMKATGIRHEVQNERLVIHIVYEFQKA